MIKEILKTREILHGMESGFLIEDVLDRTTAHILFDDLPQSALIYARHRSCFGEISLAFVSGMRQSLLGRFI